MNWFLRIRLQLLLVLAVLLLIGQLLWPNVVHWWNLPSPGTIGLDQLRSESLARDFLVYLPDEYRSKEWPLVVFLHGSGERGDDPSRLRDHQLFSRRPPAIVAIPQCLPTCNWKPESVADLVRYITTEYRVDPKRIYLIGYSMGGSGTWQTAAAHPEMFAAIVPIAGGGDLDGAKPLSALPIWAFHGAEDKVVPVAQSEQMIDSVRAAGGEPRLTVIPDAGHGICQAVCERSDLWTWLSQQRRPN